MNWTEQDLQEVEMKLLLEGIFRVYGCDFRDYSEASLRRRLRLWLAGSGFHSFSAALGPLIRDSGLFTKFLQQITVHVSEMFRDPAFFRTLRRAVIPHLKTLPVIRIWHAGCATGQEAYSMAILLQEEELHDRCRIYATDISPEQLRMAQEGAYPLKEMKTFASNYQKSGGKAAFSDYYTVRNDCALLMPSLKKNIIFSPHDLVTDPAFREMHLILCRNVLIYFQAALKRRVLDLFHSCLAHRGILCLGLKENLIGQEMAAKYDELVPRMRIFRKRDDADRTQTR